MLPGRPEWERSTVPAWECRSLGRILGVSGALKEHLLSARLEHFLHRLQRLLGIGDGLLGHGLVTKRSLSPKP